METEELIKKFLKKTNTYAVVGVSENPEKNGYKIYQTLKNLHYEVYPINPKIDEISGDRCYHLLSDLEKTPDIVNIVVPPEVTEKIVKQCKELGINNIWIQPGAESKTAIDFCEENNMNVLYNVCVMLEGQKYNE